MSKYAIIIAATLAISIVGAIAQTEKAELKSKQDALSKSLSKVKQKRAVLQQQLRKKTSETNTMMKQIHAVDAEMSKLNRVIDKTASELKFNKSEQTRLAKELIEQTERLDTVKKQVARRIRAIYISGNSAPLTMVVTSDDFSDLASHKAFMERIASRDRELFNEVRVLRDMILAKKKEKDRIVAKIVELQQQQQVEMKSLETARSKKKDIFNVLKAQQDQLEDQVEQMLRESRKLEASISEIQARTAGTVPIYKGNFIRPVSGRLSSGFGMRTHPISGKRKMHTGVDWAAPSGTTIKAAGSGKVITAAYLNGYGNTVVIDHGGGISTLYGHCSRLHVKVGQSVKVGQKIAAVGSTGYSTGPHLHFEVRVNGKPVNPLTRF
ncbi:peptidoglycan DD-metalloendopeptidase family protein [Kamptonema cortianum]|nr:peptidoglycan DD-metalloendopeptidase family protein [Geitlerinema splendidum]MDK3162217.1 peptidoglycan DD-metalloendopeptidase family protein [Kamptonema cortianum]